MLPKITLINTLVLASPSKRMQAGHKDYNEVMVELIGKGMYFHQVGGR
jgi:hypothetical protein